MKYIICMLIYLCLILNIYGDYNEMESSLTAKNPNSIHNNCNNNICYEMLNNCRLYNEFYMYGGLVSLVINGILGVYIICINKKGNGYTRINNKYGHSSISITTTDVDPDYETPKCIQK
mmetsp:Transcript_34011/g.41889  ORF Transcript_34011/g.41889 Transcript_34011/m.41889 type:complete len:119 (-) Transcript_34011:36-392(-)